MSSPLLPPERMALTVARAQIKRGEDPTPNVAAVLIMALARLIDKLADEEKMMSERQETADNVNWLLQQAQESDFDTPNVARAQIGILADIACNLSIIADAADVFSEDLIGRRAVERLEDPK